MEKFWGRFFLAITSVVRSEVWGIILSSILFIVGELSIMMLLSWIRSTLRTKYRSMWPSLIFSVVRWTVLMPIWMLATIGVAYAFDGENTGVDGAVGGTIIMFIVYIIICISMYYTDKIPNKEW